MDEPKHGDLYMVAKPRSSSIASEDFSGLMGLRIKDYAKAEPYIDDSRRYINVQGEQSFALVEAFEAKSFIPKGTIGAYLGQVLVYHEEFLSPLYVLLCDGEMLCIRPTSLERCGNEK